MNKWFTVAYFDVSEEDVIDACQTENEAKTELHGPFETDKQRNHAIRELIEENCEGYIMGIVRFDIEGEGVPEIVE